MQTKLPKPQAKYLYPDPRNPRRFISRQRVWQIKQERTSHCSRCGKPYKGKGLCHKCNPRLQDRLRALYTDD